MRRIRSTTSRKSRLLCEQLTAHRIPLRPLPAEHKADARRAVRSCRSPGASMPRSILCPRTSLEPRAQLFLRSSNHGDPVVVVRAPQRGGVAKIGDRGGSFREKTDPRLHQRLQGGRTCAPTAAGGKQAFSPLRRVAAASFGASSTITLALVPPTPNELIAAHRGNVTGGPRDQSISAIDSRVPASEM